MKCILANTTTYTPNKTDISSLVICKECYNFLDYIENIKVQITFQNGLKNSISRSLLCGAWCWHHICQGLRTLAS